MHTRIPRYIDDPPQILIWRADEIAPLLLGMVLGILLDKMLVFLGLGFLASLFYRRYRDTRPDGYMLHLLYWYGVYPSRARGADNPFRRRFLP